MIQCEATFFDGETAASRAVNLTVDDRGLSFDGPQVAPQNWRFDDLAAINPPHPGMPLRISNKEHPGARLVITGNGAIAGLAARAPQLRGGFSLKRARKPLVWLSGSVAGLALAAYLILQLAPQRLAFLLPDSWRNSLGTQIETSLTGGAKLCAAADGDAALAVMAQRIAEGNPQLPVAMIRVYDIPVMNAFALPGGHIVVTAKLIGKAQTPEEVAGVLAHELGHVYYRHSEAQLVRAMGLELLIGMATGGNGGEWVSSMAGVAAILSYSRDAEAEADGFANQAMESSAIDPMGLKRFFEIVLKEEGADEGGSFGKIGNVFSTHPGTRERIKAIHPLPAGIAARPVMSQAQWEALKNICH